MCPDKKMILTAFLFFLGLLFIFQSNSMAALCAFRNPDRDVYILFPKATGYRSVIKVLNPESQAKIEEFLGQPLDYDEGDEHTFYQVLKDEEVTGIIRPHAERGRYGIVEMVWALALDGKIIDFLIQRSREKGTGKLKSEEFRKQFRGKTLNTPFTEGKSKKANTRLFKPVEGAERALSIIAYSAKKNLFWYKLFFPEYKKEVKKGLEKESEK